MAGRNHRTATYLGPIPEALWHLVFLAHHQGGIAVSANLAREEAEHIALAASLGWLSTVSLDGKSYGRTWRATAAGMIALEHKSTFSPTLSPKGGTSRQ